MDIYIKLFLIALLLIINYIFWFDKQNFIEKLTTNEAIQNIASLYNTDLLTVSNLTIPSGGNITVKTDSANMGGVVNLGNITSSRTDGTIDINGSGILNINTTQGASIKNDLTVGNQLIVNGVSSLKNNLSVDKNLTVTGSSSLKNTTINGTFGPITTRSISKTVSGDDNFVTLNCNSDEILTGCSCYGAWKNCDGVKYINNAKSCEVYSGDKDITAYAICMKIGTGTS